MAATVLVVEDERKLRDLVRSYLERAGFAVLSTESGAEAITLAASVPVDLVVLDLGLPHVPGETVARELRAAGHTPLLMLTARSAEEDRIRGLELGADDYVTKPFSPRELVLRLQAILRRGSPAAWPGPASTAAARWSSTSPRDWSARAARRWSSSRPSGDFSGAGCSAGPGVFAAGADQPGPRLLIEGYERTVDSHVKNLRRKMKETRPARRLSRRSWAAVTRLGLARDG